VINRKKFYKNKYLLSLLIFGVWMTFFDGNGFSRQFKVIHQRNVLHSTVNEKKKEIEKVKRSLKMLKDKNLLERYAREEYRFKRHNEEIFIIVAKE
jgi:cell division protein DivIC